jgi:hypothetical protein
MNTLQITEAERFRNLYSIYTTLYVNDVACNWVKETEPYIDKNDKEAHKIYLALRKRAMSYFRYINKSLKTTIDMLAEYNEGADLTSEDDIHKLCNSIALIYKKNGIDEDFAKIETMRILIEVATNTSRESFRILKIDTMWDCYQQLKDMTRVVNNLWTWMARNKKSNSDKPLDIFEYKSVNKRFDKVTEDIFNKENFIRIYNRMVKETNDRKSL